MTVTRAQQNENITSVPVRLSVVPMVVAASQSV